MRNQKIVNIKELLETSSLSHIMQKGMLLNNLNQRCQQVFPKQFSGLYRITNFTEYTLHIDVASAVVRQGFLFHQQELLKLVNEDYPEIQQLRFRINPQLSQ